MLDNLLFTSILLAALANLIFLRRLADSVMAGLQLTTEAPALAEPPLVSVIIPAYNEVDNIGDCLRSVLATPPEIPLEVIVVDDQSTDQTPQIVAAFADSRLQLVHGGDRPTDQLWRGKNWACWQGYQKSQGTYLLFIDADVRLAPTAIGEAISLMAAEELDLLSCVPHIICGCWAEWLLQPIVIQNILVGFNFSQVNDPSSPAAFGIGMFMLWPRSFYTQINGHQAVAAEVVEDVELARLVKFQGGRYRYQPAPNWLKVQMYRSLAALWEGWTKNLYASTKGNWPAMVYLALAMLLVYSLPWLLLIISVPKSGLVAIVSIALISLQLYARQLSSQITHTPVHYWWLSGIGGCLMALMAIDSVIKTETGWGWTWRGRALAAPDS
jgi:glycosyltransferase involved in cell wall biosynthesis